MDLRSQVDRLAAVDDLATVDERLTATDEPFAVAAEAARTNGPALVFEDVPGTGRLVAGVRGGPDQMARRERRPRSRIAEALGLDRDVAYTTLLECLAGFGTAGEPPDRRPAAATPVETDLTALSLPRLGTSLAPVITAGIVAAAGEDGTRWAPVRGTVVDPETVHVRVPANVATAAVGGTVRLALGVPTAAHFAAHLTAGEGSLRWDAPAPDIAAVLGDVAVAEDAAPSVPASAEVVVEASAAAAETPPPDPAARWEAAVPTESLRLSVEALAAREDPLLPVVPIGEPLADDVHTTGLVEAARLYSRVNGYWGVSPVEWVSLPAEAGLGICLVASEILYAGFEWQLANTLFSYAPLFDKVFIFDRDSSPDDLGRALDDIWVKAHPSRDWTFSEPRAPAPTATHYREDGETGARLYVNAAWDPRWDEEYIAPEVGFETTYSEELQAAVLDRWEAFGFPGGEG